MNQRKIYKTVETIANRKFASENEMLVEVLNQIVENEEIGVTGGRVWKLNQRKEAYELLYQIGTIEKIDEKFKLKLADYPLFDLIAKERTILGDETNEVLREKGIFKYSASGVGEKFKVNDKPYYEYLLALNSNEINEDFRITLNIVSTALTSQIKQKRFRTNAKELKADLDKARELQKSILPEHEYTFHEYTLFGVTHPAEIVGGDFFDYLEIGDEHERLGVTVGDAASKGVAAAAEAMYTSGALRMASNFELKIAPLMKRMNQLVNKIFADDKFVSLFYGELSTNKGGLFLYSNAGHNPPFFIKKNSDAILQLDPTGPVLGPAPNARYTVENINFEHGDVLLIYSDGITESANLEFEAYGEERLIECFKKNRNSSSREICYSILEDVLKFSKDGKYSDDKTLVVIKRDN
jgi:sigma-B regulation protein RsbU (phosphoserine phosphatase)